MLNPPTLGKFCRTLYKQHIKLATKLTYRKHCKAKPVDILHKSKDKDDKEQVKANTESSSDEYNKIMTNAYDQDLLSLTLKSSSQKFRIPPDFVPKSCHLGFKPKLSVSPQTEQK